MAIKDNMRRIVTIVDEVEFEEVKKLAKYENRSTSSYVRQLIIADINDKRKNNT